MANKITLSSNLSPHALLEKINNLPVDECTRTVVGNIIWFDIVSLGPDEDKSPEWQSLLSRKVLTEPDKGLVKSALLTMGFPPKQVESRLSMKDEGLKEVEL